MGCWSDINVDGMMLWSSKSYLDQDALSLFQERDRRTPPAPDAGDDEEPQNRLRYQYSVTAQEMRDRLDVLGFTVGRARADYARAQAEEIEMHEEWVANGDGQTTSDEVAALRARTFDVWQAMVARVAPRGFQFWDDEKWRDDPDGSILCNHGEYGFGAGLSDERLMLRAILDALPDAKEVVADFSAMVYGGYYEPDEPVCANARKAWAETHPVYGRIVILTEGRSDTRILSAAMAAMNPHLVDLFGFLDFDGLKLQGSADSLAKTVRAFVGARMSARVIAIFDNDTAGAAALDTLTDIDLPSNIKVIALPPSAVGSRYPTQGPHGLADMDVNGLACSIELYLGPALVMPDGGYHPVRWTGWNSKLGRYQGAVEHKEQIESNFMASLASCLDPAAARQRFPDLAEVVDHIAFIFAKGRDSAAEAADAVTSRLTGVAPDRNW